MKKEGLFEENTFNRYINALTDKYKRLKARAYATIFVCLPIWILWSYINGPIQKSDAVWGIVLLCLGVLFCDGVAKYSIHIKKCKKLRGDYYK